MSSLVPHPWFVHLLQSAINMKSTLFCLDQLFNSYKMAPKKGLDSSWGIADVTLLPALSLPTPSLSMLPQLLASCPCCCHCCRHHCVLRSCHTVADVAACAAAAAITDITTGVPINATNVSVATIADITVCIAVATVADVIAVPLSSLLMSLSCRSRRQWHHCQGCCWSWCHCLCCCRCRRHHCCWYQMNCRCLWLSTVWEMAWIKIGIVCSVSGFIFIFNLHPTLSQ